MIIKKEIYPEIKENSYFLNFDSNIENYCFVNFDSIDAIESFIKEQTLLKLYNDWLDFIGNCCYICESYEEIGLYQFIKVNKVNAETLEIDVIKSMRTDSKKINFTKVKQSLVLALKDYDISVVLEIAKNKKNGWQNGCEHLNDLDENTIKFVYAQLNN